MNMSSESKFRSELATDKLGSCIRIVTTEINAGISELVQNMAFIQNL